jgi:3-oxoacyl-[acyl-carrier protein] reductase
VRIVGALSGKVAVVTGASKGIGAGIAKALAVAGANVVVNYASNKEGAERVVNAIVENGGNAIAIQADVAKSADVRRLFEATERQFGSLDILINNAAVFQFDPLDEVTEDEFHRQFNTNVLGPVLASQEAVKQFGPEGGSIINISSVASTYGMPTSAVYASTKGALEALTRVLANELAPRKIRVNAIAPGPVETEGLEQTGLKSPDFERQMIASTPLGRMGQPDDIARVAVFLASDDSGWMTGERLVASGGFR